MRRTLLLILATLALPLCVAHAQAPAEKGASDEGSKAARTLLRARCVSCHGPEKQEGGLRLDIGRRVLQGGDSGKAVIAGQSDQSPLILRVTDTGDERMPPEGEGTPLTKDEVEVLRKWIAAGAPWPDEGDIQRGTHWAYQPIVRPQPPAPAGNVQWVRNPIDAFVLANLQNHKVAPAPEAEKDLLIRRVYLDLLGLPPTPEQLREFLDDDSPEAYDRMVTQALDSPHYGERWGRHWLDLARYADSDGYEKDRARPNAWRYREWVIQALNQDMPFDQFTIEQIAGDMLPDAGISQRVATGFHRNTLHNTEGGTDQEEDRVKKTVDRINTIGSIWLGLTVGCAQCHTHKYDPITQREYYQLYALVNSMDEKDVPAPTPAEATAHAAAVAKHDATAKQLTQARDGYVKEKLATAQAKWESNAFRSSREPPAAERKALKQPSWSELQLTETTSKHGATLKPQDDGSLLAEGENKVSDVYTVKFKAPAEIAAIRLEVLPDKRLPKNGPGRAANGNFVLTTVRLATTSGDKTTPVKLTGARADFSQKDWAVGLAINDAPKDGWAVSPEIGKHHVAAFQLEKPIAGGSEVTLELDQNYEGETHNLGRFRVTVSSDAEAPLDGLPSAVAEALKVAADQRTAAQKKVIADYYRTVDPDLAKLEKQLADHQAKKPKSPAAVAQAVVERPDMRETKIHLRGNFLNPGDVVDPRGLDVLPSIPTSKGAKFPSRLELAKWLVSADQPLTARVTVNRIWQRYFGRGLVATVDDFGTQGEEPTHPDLLDWLASELQEGGWRLKRLHRLIVTSATYRQSSNHRPELLTVDPENEWLARYPRRRVEAEIVRDLALSVAGLLDPKIGGPSVRPPQPAEYSALTYANSAKWAVSNGGDKYRRGLYTFFQRTSPYPMLMTFDSPDSNECTARRSESNTPLQALTLWNDIVFFECSQQLGRRIATEKIADSPTAEERIDYAIRLCFSRVPDAEEVKTLVALHQRHVALCSKATDQQRASLIGADAPKEADPVDVAAWVLTGRVLLNLDAFITKQ